MCSTTEACALPLNYRLSPKTGCFETHQLLCYPKDPLFAETLSGDVYPHQITFTPDLQAPFILMHSYHSPIFLSLQWRRVSVPKGGCSPVHASSCMHLQNYCFHWKEKFKVTKVSRGLHASSGAYRSCYCHSQTFSTCYSADLLNCGSPLGLPTYMLYRSADHRIIESWIIES